MASCCCFEPERARTHISLAIPDDVTCKVTGSVRSPTPLRFAAGEAPFGLVRKTDAVTAHILSGDAGRGMVFEAETKKDGFHRLFPNAFDSLAPASGVELLIDAERVAGCTDLVKK